MSYYSRSPAQSMTPYNIAIIQLINSEGMVVWITEYLFSFPASGWIFRFGSEGFLYWEFSCKLRFRMKEECGVDPNLVYMACESWKILIFMRREKLSHLMYPAFDFFFFCMIRGTCTLCGVFLKDFVLIFNCRHLSVGSRKLRHSDWRSGRTTSWNIHVLFIIDVLFVCFMHA